MYSSPLLRQPRSRKRGLWGKIAVFFGALVFVVVWLAAMLLGSAVSLLALWALGHFAFGWW